MPIWDEAIVHYELYRILKNLFEVGFTRGEIQFTNIIPEWKIGEKGSPDSQRADLVITIGESTPFIIIEIKAGKQNVNPAKKEKVQEQVIRYAKALEAPYYIITDGEQISCYRTKSLQEVASIGKKTRVLPGTRIKKREPIINQGDWIKIMEKIVMDFNEIF